MSKIRKLPKRQGKKVVIKSLRNPFNEQNLLFLPTQIAEKLKSLDRIVLRHIDQLVCQPQDSPQANIQCMKQAIYQQQLKISGLKCSAAYSKRKKSATQAEIQFQLHQGDRESNKDLEGPVIDNLHWMIEQNSSRDFF